MMTKFQPPEEKADYLQSLAKGLAVIEAFGPDHPEMTLSTIARRVGLSPGSTRRVLLTLVQLGFMGFRDQRYHLQARTLQLGYAYLSSLPVVSLFQPRLAALSEKLNQSCSIMVLDGKDCVCIARATARRLERDYMGVGTRFPAHATSAGKVLLGELSDAQLLELYGDDTELPALTPFTITRLSALLKDVRNARQDGFACISQEVALGLESISVPIRIDREARYALSISAQVGFGAATLVERYLADAAATAKSIATALSAKL
jgi:IclR family transcriptional regulator, pca regulon regulatory protein